MHGATIKVVPELVYTRQSTSWQAPICLPIQVNNCPLGRFSWKLRILEVILCWQISYTTFHQSLTKKVDTNAATCPSAFTTPFLQSTLSLNILMRK